MGTGCWFIYCRVPRAIKAPLWDQETIYTAGRKEARDQVLCSFLPRMRRGRASWILQPLSRCSDGYFILPCILETERWIICWSGMEVDETAKWEEVSTRKGKDCDFLFVCSVLATECRILVPRPGIEPMALH